MSWPSKKRLSELAERDRVRNARHRRLKRLAVDEARMREIDEYRWKPDDQCELRLIGWLNAHGAVLTDIKDPKAWTITELNDLLASGDTLS